jgi:hypothetical protein
MVELVLVSLTILLLPLAHFSYLLLWPIILVCTPGSSQTVQSIMFALNAPVRYGPVRDQPLEIVRTDEKSTTSKPKSGNGRREAVAGGDVVRDCAVIE